MKIETLASYVAVRDHLQKLADGAHNRGKDMERNIRAAIAKMDDEIVDNSISWANYGSFLDQAKCEKPCAKKEEVKPDVVVAETPVEEVPVKAKRSGFTKVGTAK